MINTDSFFTKSIKQPISSFIIESAQKKRNTDSIENYSRSALILDSETTNTKVPIEKTIESISSSQKDSSFYEDI